ncbi:MAG: CHAT domain-containing tetratricopeptide repeat protein [Acidobacteriota bacterium]
MTQSIFFPRPTLLRQIKWLLWSLLILWLGLALGVPVSRAAHHLPLQQAESVEELSPTKAVERELQGGQTHTYTLTIEAGQFTVISIKQQRRLELVMTIMAPDMQKLAETTNDEVSLLAETSGKYQVQIRAKHNSAPASRYEIHITPIQAATAQAKARALAERNISEGTPLFAKAKTASIREAIEKFQTAVSLSREARQPSLEAYALLLVAQAYLSLNEKMQTAREYINQALSLARAEGNQLREAQALRELGRTYLIVEGAQEAISYFDQSLKIHEAIGNLKGKANALQVKGHALIELGNQQEALNCYEQALAAFKAIGDRPGEASIYNGLALTYRDLGDFQNALENYQQALLNSQAVKDAVLELMVFNNMGIIYKDLGDYPKALDSYQQSLNISRRLDNVVAEAQLLNNIGNVHRAEGNNPKALEYYNQALPLFRRLKMRGGEAMALNNIGAIYYQLEDPQKALDYHEQSRQIRVALGDRRGEASAFNQAGRAWHKLGNAEKALDCLRRSLEIRKQLNDPLGEAENLLNIARVERDRGQLAESRTQSQAALSIIESLRANIADAGLRATYVARMQETYEFYVSLLMLMHQQNPSSGYNAMALDTSERIRARVLLELLAEARADIRQGVDLALLERERALQKSLNASSEKLTQLLGSNPTQEQKAAAEKASNDILISYQEVQAQIRRNSPRYAALTQPQPLSATEIQQQLDDQTVLLEFALGENQSWLWAVTRTTIDSYQLSNSREIESAARKVYELLIARQPRKGENATQYRSRVNQADAQWQTASSSLSQLLFGQLAAKFQNEWKGKRLAIVASGALEYIPFSALPVPVVGSPSTVVSEQTAGDRSAANQQPVIHSQPRTIGYRPLIAEREIINLPSASVLAAIRRETAGRKPAEKTLAVIADPVFEASDPRVLSAGKRASNKPLTVRVRSGDEAPMPVENQRLSTAPQPAELLNSMRSFTLINERGGFSRLPFSRDEAEAITSLTAKNASLKATDFQANRANVVSGELSHFRILHFATHGLLNSEHPELSGLVLSLVDEQGKPQNGFLRMHEIYNLNLPASLVVLSACQTALGKQIKGEGLVGLTRGFMYAGTERVVASLWQVDDLATAELMKNFYRAMLKDGKRPSEALRLAQLAMFKQKPWSSPYYWAAFTIQGDWK